MERKRKERKIKIVINKQYGGFGLSSKALLWLWKKGVKEIGTPVKEYFGGEGGYADAHLEAHPEAAKKWKDEYLKALDEWKNRKNIGSLFLHVFSPDEKFVLYGRDIERDNLLLIECVEVLGEKASSECADLKVVEIPDGVEWEIEEYDGMEWVAEKHRTWG